VSKNNVEKDLVYLLVLFVKEAVAIEEAATVEEAAAVKEAAVVREPASTDD
jgi:hypothetical protein